MQEAKKQTAVFEQRLGKHVPTETNTHATIVERYFRCGPRRGVIKKTTGVIQLVEGGQFIWALQGSLRRDDDPVQLRVETRLWR
jgi:hypothetical protein